MESFDRVSSVISSGVDSSSSLVLFLKASSLTRIFALCSGVKERVDCISGSVIILFPISCITICMSRFFWDGDSDFQIELLSGNLRCLVDNPSSSSMAGSNRRGPEIGRIIGI